MNMLLARRLTSLKLTGVSVMATMNVLLMVTYGDKVMGEDKPKDFPAKFSDHELKQKLNPMEYHVTQEAGTERAFSGAYWNNKKEGTYDCIVCGHKLFDSSTKFDSGTGWPSFSDVVEKGNVKLIRDVSHGMARTEVVCSNCGAHLGHVFNDGPKPTGLRYCMNSASLKFKDRQGQGNQEL